MKAKYFLIVLALLGTLASCDDFLMEDPKGDLAKESFYKNADDLTIAVNAVVDAATNGFGLGHRQVSGLLSYGDDIITTRHDQNKADMRQVDQFNISPGNPKLTRPWQKMYEVIYQSNAVLEGYVNAEGDEQNIESIVSVARFYRAMHYFEAVRAWGAIPMPLSTEIDRDLTSSTEEEVYAQILLDLDECIKWLPENQGNNKAYPTIWAAKTMLADVYMTMAGFPLKKGTEYHAKALTLLRDVKDNSGASLEPVYATLSSYDFDANGNYIKDNEYNSEFIFQILGIHKLTLNGYASDNGNTYVDALFYKGWSDIVAEINFFNRFPRDDRFEVTFDEKGVNHPLKGGVAEVPWQQFITGHPTFKKKQFNWKVKTEHWRDHFRNFDKYRYTDVLLMFAEADAMANGTPSAEAYQAVNDVRVRANKSKIDAGAAAVEFHLESGLASEAFVDTVLNEVAFEFAAEGTRRWFDLVRTEKVEEAMSLKVAEGDMVYTSDRTYSANGSFKDVAYGPRNLFDLPLVNPVTKGRYYFPIPSEEMLLNPGLTQNEAYR